jgi:prepilin-type N-terminal cleavage/methylation domain-containing protein
MKQKAFSIVELLTVIAIIGILFSIVVGSTTASRSQARDNKRITDLKEIQLGLALYYDVNKAYPIGTDTSILVTKLVLDKYLPQIPNDPSGGQYEYTGTASAYCLGTKLEVATPPNDNNTTCSSKPSGSVATYKVQR